MMNFSKALVLASAIATMAIGCADESTDETDLAAGEESANDPLAQESSGRIPVGGARDAGGRGATTADAGVRDAGQTSGRLPTTPTQPPTQNPSTAQQTIDLPDPNGLFFAKIDASGDGCPRGSWNARISPDGKAFTVTFSSYQVRLNTASRSDRITIDCTLNIAMTSPSGVSYGVTSISYSGYSFLEPGVRGTVSAYYNFTGQRLRTTNGSPYLRETIKEFAGPYDADFVYNDVLKSTDVVFSECRSTSTLNINTSMRLINSVPPRSGFLNMAAIDGNTESKLVVRFDTRPCRLLR